MAEPNEQGAETQADDKPGAQLGIQRIYTKDISFETPHSPNIFTEQWTPQLEMQVASTAKPLENDHYDVTLTVTATVKLGEKTAFLVEVHQAGLFVVTGFGEQERNALLGSYCPTILYPYARELISSLVSRGGFPQLNLAPINFEAMYAHKLQSMQEAQGVPPGTSVN